MAHKAEIRVSFSRTRDACSKRLLKTGVQDKGSIRNRNLVVFRTVVCWPIFTHYDKISDTSKLKGEKIYLFPV